MSKHKCGTCRFFQEARLASSGWCHHPQRKTTSDLMIMVRKNELACRDEWSHDLWEARTEAGSLAAGPPQIDHFSDRKMPPATELDIAALVKAGASSPGGAPPGQQPVTDDVVLSELGAASGPVTPSPRSAPAASWAAPEADSVEPAPPSPLMDIGTRNAIIKAREAFRERSRLEAVRLAEIARLASQSSEAATGEPANVSRSDIDHLPDQSTTDQDSFGAIDASLPTEPDRRGLVDNTVNQPVDRTAAVIHDDAASSPRHADESEVGPLAEDVPVPETAERRRFTGPDLRGNAATPAASSHSSAETDHGADRDSRSQHPNDALNPSISERSRSYDSAELDWFAERPDSSSSAVESRGVELGTSRSTAHRYEADSEYGDVEYDNIDAPEANGATEAATKEEQFDLGVTAATVDLVDVEGSWLNVDVVEDDEIETVEQWIESALSAHLPRICQTCRDFRPAESGNRGWCANQWAFTHRRMVDAGDEIPCDSILGHWWAPVDEVWLEAADVSSHGQPTPLLDAWLPHHRDDVPARRRS